jgi:ketosteroid isomerase-like protein
MPSKAQIEQAIRNHFEAWNSKDKARWLANFAEDVRLEDPVGGLPKIGRDGLEKSWLNSFKDGHDWKIEVVLMQVCADQAALHVKNHGKVDNNPVELDSNRDLYDQRRRQRSRTYVPTSTRRRASS